MRLPAIRRRVLAVAATTALASAAAVSLRLLGAGGQDREAGIAGVVFVSLAWLPVTRHWNARAYLCWASSMFLVIVYLTCALGWTFARPSGAACALARGAGRVAVPVVGSTSHDQVAECAIAFPPYLAVTWIIVPLHIPA